MLACAQWNPHSKSCGSNNQMVASPAAISNFCKYLWWIHMHSLSGGISLLISGSYSSTAEPSFLTYIVHRIFPVWLLLLATADETGEQTIKMRRTTFIVSFIASLALARPQIDSSQLSGLPPCAVSHHPPCRTQSNAF